MKKLESTAIVTSASTITSNYTYDTFQKTIDGDVRSYETLRIKELDIKKNGLSLMKLVYSYDNFDNIKTIYRYDNGSLNYSFYEYFSYDEYNQLEYHAQVTSSTERINTYTYDIRGNIETISKIVLQNGRQSSSAYIILGYETSGWLDQLRYVTIDGVTYNVNVYDVIGNPSNYMDYYINYEQRSIKSITSTDNLRDLHFSYNANGIRTKKYDVYRGIEINYILDGSKILKESRSDGKVLNYFYDHSGSIIGFKYDNSHYYYVKNLQNDIIGITNSNGNLIVKYVYDAYGNIISINDTSGINLGKINPFRFKSYYYDEETKFYYLNSRYYDPLIGRFINADDIGMLAEGELNLYAYCANNPVMNFDPSGYSLFGILGAIIATINPVVLVAAVAIVACVMVIAVIENQDTINAIGNGITNAINDVSSNIKDKISEKSESKAKQHEGEIWTVYTLIDDDGVKYVGRTKNFDARMRAHSYSAKTGDLVLGNKIGGLSYFEARGLEQTLMLEHHSLKSFGMVGRNSINGISPKNILKAHYMQAASDYIHNILSNEFYISIGI